MFGEIRNNKIYVNQIGKVVQEEWLQSATIRKEIELDEWVIMPNHLHGIVIINSINSQDKEVIYQEQGASLAPLQRNRKSLASFVAGFKSSVTKRVRLMSEISDFIVWQRNFYESVIKDDIHLDNTRLYIQNNPVNWHRDPEKLLEQNDLIDLPF